MDAPAATFEMTVHCVKIAVRIENGTGSRQSHAASANCSLVTPACHESSTAETSGARGWDEAGRGSGCQQMQAGEGGCRQAREHGERAPSLGKLG